MSIKIQVLIPIGLALAIGANAQQGSITGEGGFAGAGLGTKAGPLAGATLELRKGKLEALERLSLDLGHKVGSGEGRTVSNVLVARYGARWRAGGGILIERVTASFGSRTIIAPLAHLAYSYDREGYRIVPYVNVRIIELGTNYTAEHRTRGFESGLELYQYKGRLFLKESFGAEVLSYHNLDFQGQHLGGYAFLRVGLGYRF